MAILKSKAIDIIQTLSEEELKKFIEFSESPYFNKNKSITRLLEAVKPFYPEFNSEKMTDRFIYEKVYGKDSYSYSAMRNLMSELIQLCEKFLVHNSLNKDPESRAEYTCRLLEEYRNRSLNNLFDVKIRKFETELQSMDVDNVEYYNTHAKLEILKYRYYLNKHTHDKRIWNGFVDKSSYELCRIFHDLYITTDILIQSADTFNTIPDESLMHTFVRGLKLESFISAIEKIGSPQSFYVALYSNLILLTLNDRKEISEKFYFKIKNSLLQNLHLFANLHLYDILKSLRSYCITRMQLKNATFIDELYEIDKQLIEKVNYDSGSIAWFIGEIFPEIVSLSIHKKDFNYAENFIEKYKKYLNNEIKNYEYNFSKACLNFENGNYDKVIELLSGIKPLSSVTKMAYKNLQLRAFYEMGYIEEGLSGLDAYKHFISKGEKFNAFRKKNLDLLHSVFLRLFRYRSSNRDYKSVDISKLIDDINSFYFLSGRNWFLDKAEELRKGIRK